MVKIDSVKQFLEIIEELSQTYPSHVVTDIPTATKFIYRGVHDESYQLLPSIFRKVITKLDEEDFGKNKYIENNLYTAWASETSILKSFIAEENISKENIDLNIMKR